MFIIYDKPNKHMTRDEEILKAARDYVSGVTLLSPSNVIHFENGAKWADEHPNLLSLWHDASEEPEKNRYILIEVVITLTPKNVISYYVEYTENAAVKIMKTEGFKCRWAYISDLLPKGGKL